jgi:hypothetical protein
MDIPRLQAMNSHWKASPPIHVMLAQFFGYERKKPSQQSADKSLTSDEEMAAFLGILTNVS